MARTLGKPETIRTCCYSLSAPARSALWQCCYESAVTEGDERFDHWVPAPGQFVQVKPGFKDSIEERAFKRASEEGGPELKLHEKTLYEVLKCEQDKGQRALHLQEVNIVYVAGERFVTRGNRVPYPLSMALFQLAREQNFAR